MLYNKAQKRKGMKHMNIKAAIWDLDGTLLNTLDDLAASTNAALTENGLPTHTVDEVRMFVGNGIGKLIERAVPDGRDNPKFQAVYDAFVAHYGAHSRDHTKPYDGILPMLDALAAKGVTLVVTVDTGVTAVREVAYAAGLGMNTVVTDHHECLDALPDCVAVVNPHRPDCPYPFRELAGVGVAFKLICACEQARTGGSAALIHGRLRRGI